MSVKPIDLQVNFSQINHVGKDQAFLKESLSHQQAVMAKESAQESLDADKKVKAPVKEADSDRINEDQGQSPSQEKENPSGQRDLQGKQLLSKSVSSKLDNPFDDPDLGKLLDLKG